MVLQRDKMINLYRVSISLLSVAMFNQESSLFCHGNTTPQFISTLRNMS